MALLTAQVLLSLATLGYSVVPAIFDTNATHATNPLWVGHARFHVVWQVMSYIGFGLIALLLIWMPGPEHLARLWITAAMGAAAYAGFFCAVFAKPLYGGENYDKNGVLPVRLKFGGRSYELEANITLFSITALILCAGAICLVSASID